MPLKIHLQAKKVSWGVSFAPHLGRNAASLDTRLDTYQWQWHNVKTTWCLSFVAFSGVLFKARLFNTLVIEMATDRLNHDHQKGVVVEGRKKIIPTTDGECLFRVIFAHVEARRVTDRQQFNSGVCTDEVILT
jgi:hypothetical protein